MSRTLIQQDQIRGNERHETLEKQLEDLRRRVELLERQNVALKEQLEVVAEKAGQPLQWNANEW